MNTTRSYESRVQGRRNTLLGNAEILRLVKQYYNAEKRKNNIMENLAKLSPGFRTGSTNRATYRSKRQNNLQARKNMYNTERAIVKRARKILPWRNLPSSNYLVFEKVMKIVPKNGLHYVIVNQPNSSKMVGVTSR